MIKIPNKFSRLLLWKNTFYLPAVNFSSFSLSVHPTLRESKHFQSHFKYFPQKQVQEFNLKQFSTSEFTMTFQPNSIIRQNFNAESELAINKIINSELNASYVYLSMAYFFDRDDVNLPGFYKFFKDFSEKEKANGEKLMEYVNKRGGTILMDTILKPTILKWESGLSAITAALELEKSLYQGLINLHSVAEKNKDPHLTDFIQNEFLKVQVDLIKELAGFVTQLTRMGPGLGEHLFDKKLLKLK